MGYQWGRFLSWVNRPEIILLCSFLSFIFSALFSVFGKDIRKYLGSQPIQWKQERLFIHQTRLAVLKTLHGDTYQLVLWAIWGLGYGVSVMFKWATVLLLFEIAYSIGTGNKNVSTMTLSPVLLGILVGQIVRMYSIVNQLYDYDRTVRKLQTKIDNLKQQLGQPP